MDNFPSGWKMTTLGDAAKWGSGGTPNRSIAAYYGGTIPWFKTGELNDGIVIEAEEFITETGLNNSSAKLFPKGSVMIAMYGATIGKCAILPPPTPSRAAPHRREAGRLVWSAGAVESPAGEDTHSPEAIRQAVLTQAVTGKLTEEWRGRSKVDLAYYHQFDAGNRFRDASHISIPNEWKWLSLASVAEIKSNLAHPLDYPDDFLIAPDNIESNNGRLLAKPLLAKSVQRAQNTGLVRVTLSTPKFGRTSQN